MQINIIKDYADALEIARKNPHFFNANGLKMMEKDFQSGSVFGAFDGQKLIGFVCFKELNEWVVELAWMAVDPACQGNGVGTTLVKDGLNLLPKTYTICETKTLSEIDPDPEYARTRKFYTKMGFTPLETISPYKDWGEDNPCQIFVKVL